MVNRPSVPEIITVNSEALQTTIRDLLPSQNGFGSELQASNVITPIIDLTTSAGGSTLPRDLQTALAFGSQTTFDVTNGSSTIANSPGFYRVVGNPIVATDTTSNTGQITITDGSTTTILVEFTGRSQFAFDLTFWLSTGESLIIVSGGSNMNMFGSVRQVADSEGAAVNPSGFPL